MSRRNRVKDPHGRPHPPGKDSPKDVARRDFKMNVDALVRMFMKDNDQGIDWAGLYATAAGRADLLRRFTNFLMTKVQEK